MMVYFVWLLYSRYCIYGFIYIIIFKCYNNFMNEEIIRLLLFFIDEGIEVQRDLVIL